MIVMYTVWAVWQNPVDVHLMMLLFKNNNDNNKKNPQKQKTKTVHVGIDQCKLNGGCFFFFF